MPHKHTQTKKEDLSVDTTLSDHESEHEDDEDLADEEDEESAYTVEQLMELELLKELQMKNLETMHRLATSLDGEALTDLELIKNLSLDDFYIIDEDGDEEAEEGFFKEK